MEFSPRLVRQPDLLGQISPSSRLAAVHEIIRRRTGQPPIAAALGPRDRRRPCLHVGEMVRVLLMHHVFHGPFGELHVVRREFGVFVVGEELGIGKVALDVPVGQVDGHVGVVAEGEAAGCGQAQRLVLGLPVLGLLAHEELAVAGFPICLPAGLIDAMIAPTLANNFLDFASHSPVFQF